jgi:hypothetical protein
MEFPRKNILSELFPWSLILAVKKAIVEVYVATVNVASGQPHGRIWHGAEMSRNLRVSKAYKQVGVSVFLYD